MICPRCAKEIPDNETICPFCMQEINRDMEFNDFREDGFVQIQAKGDSDFADSENYKPKYFDISEYSDKSAIETELKKLYDNGEKAFAFYSGGDKWYSLVLREKGAVSSIIKDKSESWCGLDVSVLHTLILERNFGIDAENMAKQINLTYVKKLEDAISCVDRGEAQCCFILNPTRVTEIRDVAAAGEKMPQKSTYFYPKLITGLVMNQLS